MSNHRIQNGLLHPGQIMSICATSTLGKPNDLYSMRAIARQVFVIHVLLQGDTNPNALALHKISILIKSEFFLWLRVGLRDLVNFLAKLNSLRMIENVMFIKKNLLCT